MAEVDAAVLSVLRRDVLAPDIVEDIVVRAIELHTSEPDVGEERRRRLTGERDRFRGELERYADAIAASGPLPSILDALKVREERLATSTRSSSTSTACRARP